MASSEIEPRSIVSLMNFAVICAARQMAMWGLSEENNHKPFTDILDFQGWRIRTKKRKYLNPVAFTASGNRGEYYFFFFTIIS